MSRSPRFARGPAPAPPGRAPACTCGDCARLDLACPGEGLQLALPLPPPELCAPLATRPPARPIKGAAL